LSADAAIHREIGRYIDVGGTIVAVYAVHAALAGLVDLAWVGGIVLHGVLGHLGRSGLPSAPRGLLTLLIGGEVRDLVWRMFMAQCGMSPRRPGRARDRPHRS